MTQETLLEGVPVIPMSSQSDRRDNASGCTGHTAVFAELVTNETLPVSVPVILLFSQRDKRDTVVGVTVTLLPSQSDTGNAARVYNRKCCQRVYWSMISLSAQLGK